ncbi:MAG: hypothetical protein ABSE87_04415 [Terracidiphilus sp.]
MPRLVRWIWTLLALHLALGMIAFAHFLLTGQYGLLNWYFWALGSLFFLVMTATECSLALICCSWFDADEPMRLAWLAIACAALARFAGTLLREISDGHLPWISRHWSGLVPTGIFASWKEMGLVVGGPLSMAFLAIGLGRVLGIQRRFRLRGALTRTDQALLVLIVAFTVSQVSTILPLLGRHPSLGTMLLWLSDPLLSLLLIEAVLVRRCVIGMGQGLVARCWGMFVLAIVTTSAGDAAIWASSHSLLPEPLIALSWFIWFVAAAAFASAPAYQLAAMSLIREESMQLPGGR